MTKLRLPASSQLLSSVGLLDSSRRISIGDKKSVVKILEALCLEGHENQQPVRRLEYVKLTLTYLSQLALALWDGEDDRSGEIVWNSCLGKKLSFSSQIPPVLTANWCRIACWSWRGDDTTTIRTIWCDLWGNQMVLLKTRIPNDTRYLQVSISS